MFGNSLSSAENKVKCSALKALEHLLSYLADEPEIEIFASLVPHVLNVAAECQKRSDEDTVSTTLDVMYDLSFCPHQSISSQLNSIIQFSLCCVFDGNLDIHYIVGLSVVGTGNSSISIFKIYIRALRLEERYSEAAEG